MSQPDYMKFLAGLWAESGNTVSSAQQAMFKDLAERMGQGLWPGPMFPWQAVVSGDASLEQAGDAFRKLVVAWKELPSTLTQGNDLVNADRVPTELLQKIFDPREWLPGTGYRDGAIRHLSEGPKLADLWQVEGKFLALLKAWTELRTLSL